MQKVDMKDGFKEELSIKNRAREQLVLLEIQPSPCEASQQQGLSHSLSRLEAQQEDIKI